MYQEARPLRSPATNRPPSSTLEGARFYRKLRSSSHPALLRGSDDKLYVVRWNDISHTLASEVLGHALLTAVGLPIPPWKPLFVSNTFIDAHREMWPETACGSSRIESGLHYASEYLGTESTVTLLDWLPSREVLSNPDDLLGAYIFDIWTGAREPRRVVFQRRGASKGWQASFIHNRGLFGGLQWSLTPRLDDVQKLTLSPECAHWNDAAVIAWIAKIKKRARATLTEFSRLVPPCWFKGNVDDLAETLSARLHLLDAMTAKELQRHKRG